MDVVKAVEQAIHEQRPPDGLLHCSGDLVGSLRHSMLRAAGAPTIKAEFGQAMTLTIGTLVHRHLAQMLVEQGVAFMQEVKLTPWLPEGWAGTADWIFYHPEYEAFVLGDLKTTKGESMRYLLSDGAKTEHIHQLSAYWYALRKMGLPLIKGVGVLYLPKNDTPDKDERIQPVLHECDLIDEEVLNRLMESRWAATKAYLEAVARGELNPAMVRYGDHNRWLNHAIAPVQERVQKVWWNGKGGVFDVKLEPHWSARYCPYPNELCDCSEQGTNKIGQYREMTEQEAKSRGYESWVKGWNWWLYEPRKGYEDIKPTVEPTAADYAKRRK